MKLHSAQGFAVDAEVVVVDFDFGLGFDAVVAVAAGQLEKCL